MRAPAPRCRSSAPAGASADPGPASIGVPRFELGTSPTRTERATRLRHTPSGYRLAARRAAPPRVSEVARVQRSGARVLDVVEAGSLGDRARCRRADAELQPERLRTDGDGLARVGGAVLGPAEHVDEVDRLPDVGQRGRAGDPEHLVTVGSDGDDVVAVGE